MTTPSYAQVASAARAVREEIVRQYRDDERSKCPAGAAFYEEYIAPEYIARAALTSVAQAGEDKTVDTMKLNAGQLVQRIMRVMDHNDAGSGGIAKLAEAIAAGILNLPAVYWHKPAPVPLGRADDGPFCDMTADELRRISRKLCTYAGIYTDDKEARRMSRRCWEVAAVLDKASMLADAPAPPAQSGAGEDDLVGCLRGFIIDEEEHHPPICDQAADRIATLTQALAEAQSHQEECPRLSALWIAETRENERYQAALAEAEKVMEPFDVIAATKGGTPQAEKLRAVIYAILEQTPNGDLGALNEFCRAVLAARAWLERRRAGGERK